jgi:hypothetical protein
MDSEILWFPCSKVMPGNENDTSNNRTAFFNAGFIVCYNHGDDEPFLARCFLKNGKFISHEEYIDDETGMINETYWGDDIIITHWAPLSFPMKYCED